MRVELLIVGLLSVERELTIRQISQKLGESYAFVHRKVDELIRQHVVLKKIYGHSSVCSLRYDSDRTIALLHLHEVGKKEAAIQKDHSLIPMEQALKKLPLRCSFIHKGKAYLVSRKQVQTAFPCIIVNPQQFRQTFNKDIAAEHIILTGFNYFIEVLMKR